jgi:hypothetical protein
MLKRALGVSLFSTVCLLSGLTFPLAARAATPDYSCYMQIGTKQVVDLTRSVCGFHAEKAAKSAAANAAYLKAVKKLIGSDQRTLNLINENSGLMVAAAQNYCAARLSGISDQQYMELQYQELMSTTPELAMMNGNSERMQQYETTLMANGIASQLASKHFCPSVITNNSRR